MAKLDLRNVTLCAASDVALEATMRALERCLDVADFREALLLSSKPAPRTPRHAIRQTSIPPLTSRESYSDFILAGLSEHIVSDFALIVQWDGFIVQPEAWSNDFLQFDYIGAPWLDFAPERNVGNGGFSLRSRRLLDAGSQPWFERSHPEDLCLCHQNRARLEQSGLRFANIATARRFSREREAWSEDHFGIHGIFALTEIMEPSAFADLLATIEPGIIGRRELLDIVQILGKREVQDKASLRRCAREFVSRYPFSKHIIRVLPFIR